DIGCTALAIKTKRFFRQIPEAMIDEAKKLDFPIIELPYFYSFSEISQLIFQQIYKEKNTQAEHEQRFLSNFMQQILN
ncbi:PucR family transcriptional regulator ligand-binding domain-containing protein, partial [Olsenella uli]